MLVFKKLRKFVIWIWNINTFDKLWTSFSLSVFRSKKPPIPKYLKNVIESKKCKIISTDWYASIWDETSLQDIVAEWLRRGTRNPLGSPAQVRILPMSSFCFPRDCPYYNQTHYRNKPKLAVKINHR